MPIFRQSSSEDFSVSVSIRLIGAFDWGTDVLRLLLCHAGDHTAKSFNHFSGNFFVQFLGENLYVDRFTFGTRFACPCLVVEVNLRKHLICERTVHDTGWVAGRVTKVHKTSFRKETRDSDCFSA
jgi:hypothetical protein